MKKGKNMTKETKIEIALYLLQFLTGMIFGIILAEMITRWFMNNKVFVFDIDGTLSNLDHRLQYIRKSPKDWTTFKALLPQDTPHEDIIWLTQCFKSYGSVVLCSARDRKSVV